MPGGEGGRAALSWGMCSSSVVCIFTKLLSFFPKIVILGGNILHAQLLSHWNFDKAVSIDAVGLNIRLVLQGQGVG